MTSINDMTTATAPAHWCVAGAGMMGLVAAYRLAQRGQRVTLLESQAVLGGLTSAWEVGGVEWDRFYHVILMSDQRLRSLLQELDLDREIEWVTTRTGFYSQGRLHSMSNSLEFLMFPPLNLWQKFRLGSTIFFGSKIKNWRSLEQIPVATWLQRWSGQSTFQKIWLPLLRAKLGDAWQRVSAMFIWAYIDRMYQARRSGMKREMFGYVPGGYRRIIAALVERLLQMGVQVQVQAPVHQVVRDEATGKLNVKIGDPSNPREASFDRVVLTTPSPAMAQSCPQLSVDERRRLLATEYLGVVCTSLLLDRPLGGYYVTNILDDGIPLTGVIEMGAIVKPEKLQNQYLVYLPQYVMANDSRLDESDDAIHERCLATLEKMYPEFRREQVRALRTAKAKYVMALPTLDYSQQRPPVVSSVPGLYLMNSARIVKGNLNVNETVALWEEDFAGEIWPQHNRLQSSEMTRGRRHDAEPAAADEPSLV
jgi:protoporphyrinogen oxidase